MRDILTHFLSGAKTRYNLRVVECSLAAAYLNAALNPAGTVLPADASPLGVSLRGFHDAYYASRPDKASAPVQDQLRELVALGWEIGSHSVSHARLTEVDQERLRHEVNVSVPALAEVTGSNPRSFCYPYGAVDLDAVEAVREAGYAYACAVTQVPGLPRVLAMPRVGVTERDRGPRFAAKLVLRGR